ncbi:MAG: hypothetical protein ABSA66_15670 [Roseiarcus sp.]|jgi:hypothetical protein
MKAVTTIDHAAGTARIEITLESIEDAGEAVNVVTGVSECLWPEIEFTDLPGDAESQNSGSAPAPAAKTERKPPDYSPPPKPGSLNARVLAAVKRLGTSEMIAIADECDLTNRIAASALSQLRRGGHIR